MQRGFTPRGYWLTLLMILSSFCIGTNGNGIRVYAQTNPALIINEIYYDHPGIDDKNEWIELYNASDTPVEIDKDWRFFDGKSNRYLPSDQTNVSIGPHEYVIITNNPEQFMSSHQDYSGQTVKVAFSSLLNSGATLKLSNDKGQSFFHEVSYQSSQGGAGNGKSLARFEDGWRQSSQVGGSPGQANTIDMSDIQPTALSPSSTPNPTEILPTQSIVLLLSLADIKQAPVGQKVRARAVVTAPPGLLSSKSFYVQDQSAGLQIYASSPPSILLGDEIEVAGKRSQSNGEIRVAAEEGGITVVGQGTLVDPQELPLTSITQDLVGSLVKTSGTLTIKGGKLTLSDGGATPEVLIRESTNIEKPKWHDGDSLTATGIISVYQDRLRILPRYQSDLVWQDTQSATRVVETDSVAESDKPENAKVSAAAQSLAVSSTIVASQQKTTSKPTEKQESTKTSSGSTASKNSQVTPKKSTAPPVNNELASRVKGLLSQAPLPQATDSPQVNTNASQPSNTPSKPQAARLPDMVYGIVIGSLALSLWQKKSSFQTIPKLLSSWGKGQPKSSVAAIISRFKEIWERGKPPLFKG